MTKMERLVRLVFLGQSGAGKSHLINTLQKMESRSDGVSNEIMNSNVRPTLGCRYLHARIDYDGKKYNLRIVDTPGFFQDGVTKATKNWRDMAEAVHKSGMTVDVFVIVLKASEVTKSKKVVQSFMDFFGTTIAPLNSIVVFTDTKDSTTEREVSFHHDEYLSKYMKSGYPRLLWKNNDNKSSLTELMGFVKQIYQQNPYEAKHFSEAQLRYTKNWMNLQRANVPAKRRSSSNDERLVGIGIPDVVVINFLTENQKAQLVKLIKNKLVSTLAI